MTGNTSTPYRPTCICTEDGRSLLEYWAVVFAENAAIFTHENSYLLEIAGLKKIGTAYAASPRIAVVFLGVVQCRGKLFGSVPLSSPYCSF
jgi:hypothetical protein